MPSSFLHDFNSKVRLEPFHGLVTSYAMALANLALCLSASADTVARSLENDVDVHTVDTDVWIVFLLWEIRVVTDTKREVSLCVKVPTWDGVVTNPESVGQEFLDGFLVTHGGAATDWCTLTDLEVTVLNLTECSLWANTSDHFENVLSVDQVGHHLRQHRC